MTVAICIQIPDPFTMFKNTGFPKLESCVIHSLFYFCFCLPKVHVLSVFKIMILNSYITLYHKSWYTLIFSFEWQLKNTLYKHVDLSHWCLFYKKSFWVSYKRFFDLVCLGYNIPENYAPCQSLFSSRCLSESVFLFTPSCGTPTLH